MRTFPANPLTAPGFLFASHQVPACEAEIPPITTWVKAMAEQEPSFQPGLPGGGVIVGFEGALAVSRQGFEIAFIANGVEVAAGKVGVLLQESDRVIEAEGGIHGV